MKINSRIIVFFAFILCYCANATDNSSLVNQVNVDSLKSYVDCLSGMKPVIYNNNEFFITTRYYSTVGNLAAQDYLINKLVAYGYTPIKHQFSETGTNLLAFKEASSPSDSIIVIGAHYDSFAFDNLDSASGACDNASGSAAVLEAARILAGSQTKHNILFALWDEEETGLIGSSHYCSSQIEANKQYVNINCDMLAWNTSGNIMNIYYNLGSVAIKDIPHKVINKYGLGIYDYLIETDNASSDVNCFWGIGKEGLSFTCAYDVNHDKLHSVFDRTDLFDWNFFKANTQMVLGLLLELSDPAGENFINSTQPAEVFNVFPNPSLGLSYITINSESIGQMQITLLDPNGNEKNIFSTNQEISANKITIPLDLSGYSSGMYYLKYQDANSVKIIKICLVK